jgi:hypothetical protein
MSDRTPAHLVPLGETGWHLWRHVVVRGTGFPARQVLRLSDPALAAAADRVAAGGDRARFDAEYAAAQTRLTAAVRATAADPLFREAVTWQNPRLVRDCLDKAAGGEPRNVRGRNHETTIASYLQRYCLKNDTIGFFGPVGWASWTADPIVAEVTPGPRLVSRRTVYFETWAIDELARRLGERPAIRPHLVPRPNAANRLDHRVVHRAGRPPVLLDEAETDVLALCDGVRTVRAIAAEMLWSEFPHLGDADALGLLLSGLAGRGLLTLDLTGPIEAFPERTLQRRLAEITDPPARDSALSILDDLVRARDRVAAAAADADRLAAAIDGLNARFRTATGASAERRHGETYAGRTIVYEDAVRDCRVRLGTRLLDELAPALGLLLTSARWVVAEAAEEYRRLFGKVYDDLAATSGDLRVPLAALVGRVTPQLFFSLRRLPPPVQAAVAGLQQRWTKILAVPPGARRHSVTSAEIGQSVREAFPQSRPPWATAIHHAPDLMLTGSDDDFLAVLGELHLSSNTLESRVFVEQHENPGELLAAAVSDLGNRRIYAVPPKDWPAVTSRLAPPSALLSPGYAYWAPHSAAAGAPGPVMPGADAFVSRTGQRLTVRMADGEFEADLLEFLAEYMSAAVVNAFQSFAPGRHRPRITIDRLVVARESWTFPADEQAWAFVRSEPDRFLAARSWRLRHGLAEHAFAKVPVEDKPAFVDFGSLPSVNILAKAVRRSAAEPGGTVTLTEMLPGVGPNWLSDGQGNGYTGELRMLAVDPSGKE